MSYTLCKKVRELEPYEPISGTYKIRLDSNESPYDIPQEIKEEIKSIIAKVDFNRYPDPIAKKLITKFAEYYNLDSETITATNGSDEMLYIISSAMLQRNSKVLIIEPDFSMYKFYSLLSENQILSVQKDDSLTINIDKVIKTANDNKVDMIIFSNPCNPTGQGITAIEAKKLVTNVQSLVIIDEAYMDFWNESILQNVTDYDNLIILKTASKAVGSAAIRLGFAIANKTLTKTLRAVKSPYNVNVLSQEIGACIYSHKDVLVERRNTIIKNTNLLYNELLKLKKKYVLPFYIYEPHTNFIFIETEISKKLYKYLLENDIAIRSFDNALRITTGSENENKELMIYIEKFILEQYIENK